MTLLRLTMPCDLGEARRVRVHETADCRPHAVNFEAEARKAIFDSGAVENTNAGRFGGRHDCARDLWPLLRRSPASTPLLQPSGPAL